MDMDDSKTEEIKSAASIASVATSVAPPVSSTGGPIPWTPDMGTAPLRSTICKRIESPEPVVAGRTMTKQEIRLIQEVRAMLDKRPSGRPCMIVVRFDTGMQVFEATPTCQRF